MDAEIPNCSQVDPGSRASLAWAGLQSEDFSFLDELQAASLVHQGCRASFDAHEMGHLMNVLDATFVLSAPDVELAPKPELPEICLAGRSNVGKSSALNALARRKQLARVSKTPGRTRLLNFFDITLAEGSGPKKRVAQLRICDLPGYGFAKAPKNERRQWGAMIGKYLETRESLKAVVMLVDGLIGAQPNDHEMLDYLASRHQSQADAPPLIVIATKVDRLPKTRIGSQLDRIAKDLGVPRQALLGFSAHSGYGHQDVLRTFCDAAGVLGQDTGRIIRAAGDEFADLEPEEEG